MRKPIGWGVVLALGLTGCAANSDGVDFAQLEHVHSVATDGEEFFLASHHGLYAWSEGSWHLRGEEFDVMGLAVDDEVFFASGHPGPTQDLPNPLGLLVSSDGGETWAAESLTGEVDFHLLEVAGNTMIGVAANYGMVVASVDGGDTWASLEIPNLTSLALNPSQSDEILMTSDGLLMLSTDAGRTFSPIEAPARVSLAEWSGTNIFLSTSSGLARSSAPGGPFIALSQVFRNVSHIAAYDNTVIVLDDQGVHVSDDAGDTFDLLY